MKFITTIIPLSLTLLFSLSCTFGKNELSHDPSTLKQSIFIMPSPDNSWLSGLGVKNFLTKESFDPLQINRSTNDWYKTEAKSYLKKYFKNIDDSQLELDATLSLKEMILKVEKITGRGYDYYLFIVPKAPKQQPRSSGSTCVEPISCTVIISGLLVGKALYTGAKSLSDMISGAQNERPYKNQGGLGFEVIYYPYKGSHRFQCITSFDLILAKKGDREFIARENINYEKSINIENMEDINYNTFSSFDNFTPKQKQQIKESCIDALGQGVVMGLDRIMNLKK